MQIVLNTSPIIFLSKIDCLSLLADCFANVYVSTGVVRELLEYQLPPFIQEHELSKEGLAYVHGALGRLHQGELEAIVLTQELKADYVILDDLLARRKAQRLEIKVMGTLGVLLLLQKRSLLSSLDVWRKIKELTEQHGLYISPNVFQQIKAQLIS